MKHTTSQAIAAEIRHQQQKFGVDKQQSLAGYLLIMQRELQEAIDGWMKDGQGRNSCLAEIVQVVATGVVALDQYGTMGCAGSTNDLHPLEVDRIRLEQKKAASLKKFGSE